MDKSKFCRESENNSVWKECTDYRRDPSLEPHIIYEKKKADGMDTLGIMILHLEETGVAQFRLRDTAGQGRYGYDYVSSDIEVSVTGTRLSYSTEIAEDEYITTYLQDELTILNENCFLQLQGWNMRGRIRTRSESP